MDAPVKYETVCRDGDREIFKRDFEALSPREAGDRAFLNCVKMGGDRNTIEISVRRSG